ncbi:MAG: RsmD family RNA methyltransferase [Fidelibacterota bacterium]
MQILGGRYGGLPIKTLKKAPYRPTASRVRKSLFDLLGDISGYQVLDLFAGSGILGFEAASRGASGITFVDYHSLVIKLLRANTLQFKNLKAQIVRMDVIRFIKSCDCYDLIFADPPYGYQFLDDLIEASLKKLNQDGRFILESSVKVFPISPTRVKTYGGTQISIWKRET